MTIGCFDDAGANMEWHYVGMSFERVNLADAMIDIALPWSKGRFTAFGVLDTGLGCEHGI